MLSLPFIFQSAQGPNICVLLIIHLSGSNSNLYTLITLCLSLTNTIPYLSA
nr:MAG TPA: hypothetical protein [Caudoviricetes sp.]